MSKTILRLQSTMLIAIGMLATGCADLDRRDSGVVGAAVGGAAGAIIGHEVGGDQGTIAGAATGAAVGAAVGQNASRQRTVVVDEPLVVRKKHRHRDEDEDEGDD